MRLNTCTYCIILDYIELFVQSLRGEGEGNQLIEEKMEGGHFIGKRAQRRPVYINISDGRLSVNAEFIAIGSKRDGEI